MSELNKNKPIGPILFLCYEESRVSSNLNSKQLRFHCATPNVHACSTSISAEIPFLGERTCFCFESTYVNYSSVSEGLLPDFSQRIFCMYRQFFKEINAKQSLEYWKLHKTFSCISHFLKVQLVQRYFKRGPNTRNKSRLLKDINAKQSPFRYLNTGNYNVFMHFPFSF